MSSVTIHNPKILDVLSALEPEGFEGVVYRAVFSDRDPIVGSLAGGRWSPPQTFEALYTSFSEEGAIAEVLYHLELQPIFPTRPVELHTLSVSVQSAIDISDSDTLANLGVMPPDLKKVDAALCQNVGHAAEFLGFDSIKVASARHAECNLVLIMGHVHTEIELVDKYKIDWSKYR